MAWVMFGLKEGCEESDTTGFTPCGVSISLLRNGVVNSQRPPALRRVAFQFYC